VRSPPGTHVVRSDPHSGTCSRRDAPDDTGSAGSTCAAPQGPDTGPVPDHQPAPAVQPTEPAGPWAAVVLAGGTSRRWNGRDKTAVSLAGRPILLHAVAALLPEAHCLVVVAPAGHPARTQAEAAASLAGRLLRWTREEPAGSGPLAGLAAGLEQLRVHAPDVVRVLLLAGDLPFARPALPRLLAALDRPGVQAAIGLDPQGHRQPLLAGYRADVLRARLAGPVADLPMRALLAGLAVVEVPVSSREAFDLDTPARLGVAEAMIGE